jgi:hypothetical protein
MTDGTREHMARLIKDKSLISLNPFYSLRDALLAIMVAATMVPIIWLLHFVMLPWTDASQRGSIIGAGASILLMLLMLLPTSGKFASGMRNTVIQRLDSMGYFFESRDKAGNLHFRRKGNVFTRWDAERATIFVHAANCDQIVAPLRILRALK